MSDYQGYDDEYDEQPQQEQRTRTVPRDVFKDMERKAKERDDLSKQLEAANRRLAFADAGINTGDPRLQYFVKGYDGELTSDAIRAAAAEAGFIDAQPQATDEELRAHDRVTQAAAGATPEVGNEDLLTAAKQHAEKFPAHQRAEAYASFLKSKGVKGVKMGPQ